MGRPNESVSSDGSHGGKAIRRIVPDISNFEVFEPFPEGVNWPIGKRSRKEGFITENRESAKQSRARTPCVPPQIALGGFITEDTEDTEKAKR